MSLIELLMVVLVVAILARIAIPAYQQITLKSRAAAAAHDFNAIRYAAFAYNVDTNEWPPDEQPGVIPPALIPYLPAGFTFSREGYRLDWENWVLPDGTPKHPETGVLLGISMTTESDALGEALIQLVGSSSAHFTLGDNYTFVIEGL